MRVVLVQNWLERERGMGSRPDGFTVHLSLSGLEKYVEVFNSRNNNKKYVPDEYTTNDGAPIATDVSPALYKRLVKTMTDGRLTGLWAKGNWFKAGKKLTVKDFHLPSKKR